MFKGLYFERISACCHEVKKNPKSPDINFFIVGEERFGSKVLVGAFSSVDFLFVFSFSGETKIANFDLIFLCDEDIVGFDVTVDDILFVEVGDTFGDL